MEEPASPPAPRADLRTAILGAVVFLALAALWKVSWLLAAAAAVLALFLI